MKTKNKVIFYSYENNFMSLLIVGLIFTNSIVYLLTLVYDINIPKLFIYGIINFIVIVFLIVGHFNHIEKLTFTNNTIIIKKRKRVIHDNFENYMAYEKPLLSRGFKYDRIELKNLKNNKRFYIEEEDWPNYKDIIEFLKNENKWRE
ncbi:hypothetical protein GF354_03465 [Candidatus Peregrinibacteria bacterium]|nr:hypothetical protein [Candidatus Peregrinibacteria bacterium]